MNEQEWIDRIVELQSLAQAGLTYGRDRYDLERYERIRTLSAEMLADAADLPLETVQGLFCKNRLLNAKGGYPRRCVFGGKNPAGARKRWAAGRCRADGAT